MECKDYFELMNMFIDEEISEIDKNKLIKHIESCESCRQEFEELKEMVNMLREEPLSELPADYHKELMEKINNENNNNVINFKPKKNKNNIYRYFGLVAVFALFIVGGSKAGLFNIKDGKFENMPSNVVNENINDTEQNDIKENDTDKSLEITENNELTQNENSITQQNTDKNSVTSENIEKQVMTRNNNITNNNSNSNSNITENTDNNTTTDNSTTTDNNTVNESNDTETNSQVPNTANYNDLGSTQVTPNGVSSYTNPLIKSFDTLSIVSVNTSIKLNDEEYYDFIINTANEYKCAIIEENDFTKIEISNENYDKFIETLKSKNVYTIEENKEDLTNSYAELNKNLTEIQQQINNNENSNELLNEASQISEKIKNIEHYKYFSDIYVYK